MDGKCNRVVRGWPKVSINRKRSNPILANAKGRAGLKGENMNERRISVEIYENPHGKSMQ
jgi:hypothetical protein